MILCIYFGKLMTVNTELAFNTIQYSTIQYTVNLYSAEAQKNFNNCITDKAFYLED